MNNEFENSRKRASSSARTRSSNLLRLEFIMIFQPPKSVLTRDGFEVLRFCCACAIQQKDRDSRHDTERRLTQELLQGLSKLIGGKLWHQSVRHLVCPFLLSGANHS